MPGTCSVTIESFAESHYVKTFEKRHKWHWDVTRRAIIAELERIEALLLTDKADCICEQDGVAIVKVDFKVAGTKGSAKKSGNRCIVAWHKDNEKVSILLLYGKTNLPGRGKNETAVWKKMVREQYPEYRYLLKS